MPYDAFISYAHSDNARSQVRELRDAIVDDFNNFAGRVPLIFFDEDDILSMDDWQKRIAKGLRESHLFLAVLSPAFFASDYCRREFEEYVRYEAMRQCLGEGVSPIYFIELPGLDGRGVEPSIVAAVDEMRQRQWCDLASQKPFKIVPWHEAGKRALEDAEVARRLNVLKEQMAERLSRADRAQQSPTNIYRHNPQFVGRVRELTLLREALNEGGSVGVVGHKNRPDAKASTATSVYGLGGMGKTELTLAYAHAFAWDYPGGRWLVRCEGLDNFDLVLRELAEPLHIEFSESEKTSSRLAGERILAALRERERSLIVLDNVTESKLIGPDVLMRLPPQEHVHIIVTTRLGPAQLAGSAHDHTFVAVDELPSDDALALIRAHQPDVGFASAEDEAAARQLVKLLDGFTLAIETAAIYLGRHAARGTIASFIARVGKELLAESEATAADPMVAVRHKEKLLERTLAPTIESLSAEELHVLTLAALLPADQIALPWLRQLAADDYPSLLREAADVLSAPPGPWRKVLGQLMDLRLLQVTAVVDRRGEVLVARMHQLIQQILIGRLKRQDTFAELRANVAKLAIVKAGRIESEWTKVDARWQLPPLVALASHFLDHGDQDNGVQMVLDFHDPLWQLGRHEECRRLLLRAFELSVTTRDLLVQIAGPLARVERSLNDDNAIGHMRWALETIQQNDPTNEVAIGVIHTNLGRLELDRGHLSEAATHLQTALTLKEQCGQSDEPTAAFTYFNLADVEMRRGNYDRARDFATKATALHEKAIRSGASSSPPYVDYFDAIRMRSMIERNGGDLVAARDMLNAAVAKADKVFPGPQISRVELRKELALVKYLLGDNGGVGQPLQEALAIGEELFGPKSIELADIIRRLTVFEDARQNWNRSRSLHQQLIAILDEHVGQSHPQTITAIKTLALLEAGMGHLQTAQELLDRVIRATEPRIGQLEQAEVEDLIDSFRAKVSVDGQLGEQDTLCSTLSHAIDVITRLFGASDERIDQFAPQLFAVGLKMIAQGKGPDGERIVLKARSYLEAAGAPAYVLQKCDAALANARLRASTANHPE